MIGLTHTLWPTREGWWCVAATLGLGFAAFNTGNNLLYLLLSTVLALIVVSGVLSEQSIRGLRVAPVVPDEAYAGRSALFAARVANRKRWTASYSLAIEAAGPDGTWQCRAYLLRLAPGAEQLVTWEATPTARGRHRFPRLRVATRFPFGLFVKTARLAVDADFVVYPRVAPVPPETRRELAGAGPAPTRRRGRGHDLYNLRAYRAGDDPRLIHWRSSAKTQALMVRELQADTALDTRLVLEAAGPPDPERIEHGLSDAASLAVHLLRGGAAVEVVGPGLLVPMGQGRAQQRRI
ncbi:MAG: DUF58 domain-containing protein, partial [Candidatus Rokubacteria bacterium]|nr:DUF58 domain-containing protein [Candidatus Rokubacteria bacterium]